jgi:putative restriction endonuclease
MNARIATLGYVANTDYGWYRHFLDRQPAANEVNFWRPSDTRHFGAVPKGAPFFFRLKSPFRAIAGYGFFARYETVPAWLAWDSFGDLNGTDTFHEMAERLHKYRKSVGADVGQSAESYQIGCIMISQPVWFQEGNWVQDDADWAGNIVNGKTLDLLYGEGQRILRDCIARTHAQLPELEHVEDSLRRGAPVLVEPRLGQGSFRIAVTKAYSGACAVTQEHSLPTLEAAHVKPFAAGGANSLANGLLLRADVHRLFDMGYVTVTSDHVFRVSEHLMDDFHNGREYLKHHGQLVALPNDIVDQPSPELLDWHGAAVYRG